MNTRFNRFDIPSVATRVGRSSSAAAASAPLVTPPWNLLQRNRHMIHKNPAPASALKMFAPDIEAIGRIVSCMAAMAIAT